MLSRVLILRKVIVVTSTTHHHDDADKVLPLTRNAVGDPDGFVAEPKKGHSKDLDRFLSNQDGCYPG